MPRTTVDLSPEHHKALLQLAARRGKKGLAALVTEAIDQFLRAEQEREVRRDDLLALAGSLSKNEAADLRQSVKSLRKSWR